MISGQGKSTRGARLLRVAMATIGTTLVACVIAGTAWGATAGWQDVWNQIKPLLSDPGTINGADNPVHWTKLKGVPAGFADGLDNGVDKAGFGLKKNIAPEINLAVDTTKIQQRVTGTCPAGRAILSIEADGDVTCDKGAVVYHGWDKAASELGTDIYTNYATVGGALEVPAGSWSIVAKLNVGANLNPGDLYVSCRLEARVGDSISIRDEAHVSVGEGISSANLPIVLTGVHSAPAAWRAAVRCKDSYGGKDQNVHWDDIKLTVTQVGDLHSQRLGS